MNVDYREIARIMEDMRNANNRFPNPEVEKKEESLISEISKRGKGKMYKREIKALTIEQERWLYHILDKVHEHYDGLIEGIPEIDATVNRIDDILKEGRYDEIADSSFLNSLRDFYNAWCKK